MSGLRPIVALTALVGVPEVCAAAGQQRQRPAGPPRRPAPVHRSRPALAAGWIEGLVTDDHSRPVVGAAVTAQGRDLLIIETDPQGRFAAARHPGRHLPAARPGPRLRRVAPRVRPGGAVARHALRRPAAPRGDGGRVRPPPRHGVLAAGMGGSQLSAGARSTTSHARRRRPPRRSKRAARSLVGGVAPAARQAVGAARDDLAHRRRARSSTTRISGARWRGSSTAAAGRPGLGRSAASAVRTAPSAAASSCSRPGPFDQPFEAFTTDDMPAGIAFVHLAGPLSTRTTWSVEAATARGGVNSWFVGGTYATVVADSPRRRGAQRVQPAALGGGERRRRLRPRGRQPQRRRRAGRRSLDHEPARDARPSAAATSATTTCAIPDSSARRSRRRCRRPRARGSASPPPAT